MADPKVSIVMPTKNAGPLLMDVLDALAAQRTDFAFETIVIDSGSTDGTVELLQQRIDRLLHVAPRDFDHGLTRNLGIEAARGELVVLLVQDAVPASEDWLAALTAPLWDDPSLAGTYARQLPRPDASRLTRRSLERWIASLPDSRRSVLENRDAFDAMSPLDRHLLCVFDNVCSCVRRSVWQRHPFRSTPIAEDLEWSREVLLAGHAIAFVPEAVVIHSHERGAGYELARTRQVHKRLGELFGLRTIPRFADLMSSWSATLADHWDCLRDGDGPRPGIGEVLRALALAIVWPLGQYLGGRERKERS